MEAFKRVEAARAKGRPTGYDFISNILTGFLQLHGDRRFGDDQAVVAGIGWLNDLAVTAIAIDRGKDTKEKVARNFGSAHPEGYRKALRQMKLAEKFGRPIVEAFVDEKQLKKFKFLQNEKKLTVILIILYLIPGIPKDVISYIVPLTPISKKDFFYYVMPCRLPAIMLSTILGSNVKSGNFTVALVVLGVALVAGIVGFLFKDVIVNKMKQHKKNK